MNSLNIAADFSALEKLKKIKQRETTCPILKQRAMTTPLMTIDDMTLKTTIASPDLYDLELTKLIYSHTIFPDLNDQPSFDHFITNLSYIDRKFLIWGIFASTYNTLGTLQITCPFCKNKFSDEIKAEQLIQPDTVKVWDKEPSFNDFFITVTYDCNVDGLYKIEFDLGLPNIAKHLSVMKLLTSEKLKDNFAKFGTLFSKSEELAIITRMIRVYVSPEDTDPKRYITLPQIHQVIVTFLTMDISDYVLDEYSKQFDDYIPTFKKPYTCSECGNDFDYIADPEASLYRQFFRSR